MSDLKKRVIDLINKNNINQKILASEIGITEATLSRNLNGVHEPKGEVILKIANYFNVSADYLLGKTNEPTYKTQVIDIQPDGVAKTQMEFLKKIEELDVKDIEQVMDYIDFLKSKERKTNE